MGNANEAKTPAAEDEARAETQAATARFNGEIVKDGICRFDVPIGTRIVRIHFRLPDLEDLAEIDQDVPLLPTAEKLQEEAEANPLQALGKMMSDPKHARVFMQRANRMLVKLAKQPRLVPTTELEPEDGTLSVRAIKSQDRIYIFLALNGLAGFSGEAAAEVAPFVEANGSS